MYAECSNSFSFLFYFSQTINYAEILLLNSAGSQTNHIIQINIT